MFVEMMFFSLFVISMATWCECKLTDKWNYLKSPDMRCYLGFLKEYQAAGQSMNSVRLVPGTLETAGRWIAKANCSIKWLDTRGLGKPDANGSYDGMIGEIQRNIIDTAWVLLRTDSLPFEPGKLTVPLLSADVGLVSFAQGDEKELKKDVTSFLELELSVWIYTLVGLFFFISLFLVLDGRPRRNRFKPHKFLASYLRNCFTMFILLLDQAQFTPRRLFGFVLAFTASAFVVFAVTGILRNTVGANLIVMRSPPTIDSLDDLFGSKVTPLLFTDFYEHQAIRKAVPGTRLYKLQQFIEKRHLEPNAKAFIDGFEEKERNYLAEKMRADGSPLILSTAFTSHFHYIICFAKGSKNFGHFKRFHHSSETFAAGTMTGLLSNKIHPYAEKILSYLFITILETNQMAAATQAIIPQIPDFVNYDGIRYNVQTLKCIDKIHDDGRERFAAFSLDNMAGVFILWSLSLTLGSVGLIIEIIVSIILWRVKIRNIRSDDSSAGTLPQAWLYR